jgi:hypothetical protein
MALEKSIKEKLASVFKVPEDLCEIFDLVYSVKILPLIQEKFLAHLVAAVEDLVFMKIREKNSKARRYRITLWKSNPKNGKASMRLWEYGAIIAYNPKNDYHDLRIFVAHELGHLLCLYQIIDNTPTENNANLFAYLAINGKNTFYKNKAPDLVYKGGELEIIDSIQTACPVTRENQAHCRLGTDTFVR